MTTIDMDSVTSYASYQEDQLYSDYEDSTALGQDAFLNLLVAQLQYQDPLEPQSNAEFVAQLAQFSTLELMQTSNDSLDSLYMAVASMNNASMTQLLGTEIVAAADTFAFDGTGETDLYFNAGADCESATISITDEDGSVVWSSELGEIEEGQGTYSWDGSTIEGGIAEEGVYTFSVTGTDANGESVSIDSVIVGIVDGMNYESGSPIPTVDGVEITLSDILEVNWLGEETESSSDTSTEEDSSES